MRIFFMDRSVSSRASTECWISSTVLRGLISQTQAQSLGKSGTSFKRSTSPGKRRLMILGRPNAILHVTTERARTDRAQPFGMIEECEVLL